MRMKQLTKRILFPLLPDSLLKRMRSRHYLKKFSELTGEEEPEMAIINDLVKDGDSVLDIGANFGAYTKLFSNLVGEKGQVLSFEPIPEVNEYLKANLRSGNIHNVLAHNFALSNSSGKANFSIPKFDHSGNNFYEGHITEGEGDITVEVQRLDDLGIARKISFVKCDVEGAELLVLKGGVEFIAKHRPIFMLEINSDITTPEAKELIQFMDKCDYEIRFMEGNKLVKAKPDSHGVNYFFFYRDSIQ